MVARKMVQRAMLIALGLSALLLAGCSFSPDPPSFGLQVIPTAITDLAQDASCVFLVCATDTGARRAADGPVVLEVDASDGFIAAPAELDMGEVGEVRLWGVGLPVGTIVAITLTARRGDEAQSATVSATVTEPIGAPDDRLETGSEIRDLFLPWIVSEHPEFRITGDTPWTSLPLRPHILEVSYCMFLSDEWELVVWWHVMIPPCDWTRMYLRRRSSDVAPSFAAEIGSRSAGSEPHTIAPPEEVWR